MLSRDILIVLSAFYAALFVIQVPRSLLRSRRKKENCKSLRSIFIFILEKTKITRNVKNTVTKNYICEIFLKVFDS